MSVMRKKIAEHMVLSAHTSPHVYSVYEVELRARRRAARQEEGASTKRAGAKLTYHRVHRQGRPSTRCAQFPFVNASIDGDNIVYKKDINLGIAVALDNGLIVPVIRNADEKNLLGLSRAIDDLAARARSKKLNPEEVQGGTFTITNPGIFGALYGLPLINQPQVAILGVGTIEKRAVVIDDAIAIRPMCHLTLGYDHRLIDGADAGRFLAFSRSGSRSSTTRRWPVRQTVAVALRGPAARPRPLRRGARAPGAARRAAQGRTGFPTAAAARAPAGHHARRARSRNDRSHVLATPRALRRRGRRAVRDRPRRRRHLPRPRPARRLSDPRPASPIAATCTATCATSKRC